MTGDLRTLIKATRLHRTLTILTAIMVPVAFANKFNLDIILLGAVFVLIYAAAGIHNAKKDNDYELPKYYNLVIISLVLVALIVSFFNLIVFFTGLSFLLLGFIYNTISRKILFGDVTILSISHNTLPIFSSSLLIGLDFKFAMVLSLFMFFTFWFVIHIKDLKDKIGDKKRGYLTVTTYFKNGRQLTKAFFILSFIFMFAGYFIFNLSNRYIIFLGMAFILGVMILYKINNHQDTSALNFMRFLAIVIFLGFIVDKTNNLIILLVSFSLGFAYFIFLIYSEVNDKRNIWKNDPRFRKLKLF